MLLTTTSPVTAEYRPLRDRQEKAIELFETRLRDNPDDFLSLSILVRLKSDEARRSGELSIYRHLATLLDAALSKRPDEVGLISARANVALNLHQFKRARDLVEHGLELDPHKTSLLALRIDSQLELGEIDSAAENIQSLVDKNPGDPSFLSRLARVRQYEGKNSDAEKLWKKAAKLAQNTSAEDPFEQAWYFLSLGRFYLKIGRISDAEDAYQKARTLTPEWWLVKRHEGERLGAQRQFDKALTLYSEAYASIARPDLAHAIGDLLVAKGDLKASAEWFEKALDGYRSVERAGYDYFTHHLVHLYSDSLNRPDDAVLEAERDFASRTTPDTIDALAWSYYKAGNVPKAEELSKRALVNGSHIDHVLYHAAMISGAGGNISQSKELLRKVAQLNPLFMEFHEH